MVKSPYHCVVDEQEGYKELKKKGSGWLCQLLPLPRLPHAGIKETFTCLSSNFLEGEDLLGITCLGLENSDKGLITLGAQQGGSISESDEVASLLHNFANVFAEQQGLPPRRSHDHKISLSLGSEPINVRPYRYPHYQKK
jgi:hypothetical protein